MSQQPLSKRDFALIQETAYFAQQATDLSQFQALMKLVSNFVPTEYAAVGHFSLTQQEAPGLGFSTYNPEFCSLYMQQALLTDPAVVRLATTSYGSAFSVDDPTIEEPRQVVSLKLDSAIQTCLTMALRLINMPAFYMAFSNFDRKQQERLREFLRIIAPVLSLTYMRLNAKRPDRVVQVELTAREIEIMKWVQEGKTNWEISMILHVSLNTVKFHLKNIMAKFGTENRWATLAAWSEPTSPLRIEAPLSPMVSVLRARSSSDPSV